jgi:intron-binding protein aquarius
VAAAESCFAHIAAVFDEAAGYRAFELLRSNRARTDYMLTRQARIIALTCTHASLIRTRLLELGFKYDTLVMEEAAQVLEVETFIPMVLQRIDEADVAGVSRLKRVVLIGDHHQLPPVVQNQALQRYSRLDQSMFAR